VSLTGLGLTFIEASRHMPFEIKRAFDLHDVPGCLGIVRAYVWRVYENTKSDLPLSSCGRWNSIKEARELFRSPKGYL
jgi:hypothetical protein